MSRKLQNSGFLHIRSGKLVSDAALTLELGMSTPTPIEVDVYTPAFIKNFNGMSLSKCALRSPIGKFCIVRVEVRGNRMFFGDGWPDFVKDNYLEIGDFLVFEYDDKSTFNVKIYGRNGCEKDVRVAKKNSDNPISLEKKEEQVQEKESFGKKAIKSNKINFAKMI
ncbi:putative b3 domain-containing protein [Quercus suber]|uniref:B3 domain-containing protein n=1 Tax=Quercus suber TaxID=58331 RepID=A0AAW0JYM8_QUESU